VIRPIETHMSLLTVDQKASQAQKDQGSHAALATQQAEAVKKADDQLKTVQKPQETEGGVKIRDKDSEKNRRDQRKRRRRDNDSEAEDDADTPAGAGNRRFDFLA